MHVLTLAGSLRAGSLNARLLESVAASLPEDATVTAWDGLRDLPHYDQDLDSEPGEVVESLRAAVAEADAVVVATPEYNGSVPGVLKNAVDWASRPRGTSSLAGKAALVISASPSPRGAQWAREDLARILNVAGAEVVDSSFGLGAAHEAYDGARLVDVDQQADLDVVVGRLTDQAAQDRSAA